MPSAEHTKIIQAPLSDVWAFVSNMDNWAPLVTGYQRHETLDDRNSVWSLKGELGGLTRIAEFKVHIDEWDDAGRVRFSLQGVNEPVTGSGSFDAIGLPDMDPAPATAVVVPPPQAAWFRRLLDRLVRALFARIFAPATTPASVAIQPASTGPARSEITFKLNLTASGMAGMVLNALLAPMMRPVAEDLADKIAAAIEA